MQVIGEAKLTQGAKQMNKPLSMACVKKLSEHEARPTGHPGGQS